MDSEGEKAVNYARFWIFDIEDDEAYSKGIDRKMMRIIGTLSYISSLILSLSYIYLYDLNFLSTYYFLFIVLIFTNLTVSLLIIFIRSRNTVKKLGSVISTVTRAADKFGTSPRRSLHQESQDSSPRRRPITLNAPKSRKSIGSAPLRSNEGEFQILLTQGKLYFKQTKNLIITTIKKKCFFFLYNYI